MHQQIQTEDRQKPRDAEQNLIRRSNDVTASGKRIHTIYRAFNIWIYFLDYLRLWWWWYGGISGMWSSHRLSNMRWGLHSHTAYRWIWTPNLRRMQCIHKRPKCRIFARYDRNSYSVCNCSAHLISKNIRGCVTMLRRHSHFSFKYLIMRGECLWRWKYIFSASWVLP